MSILLFISCGEEYQYSYGNIIGTITDATTGDKITDCTISVSNSAGDIVDRPSTDDDGEYRTKDLSEGIYTLSIEKKDYHVGTSKTVQVKAGENTKCNIALARIPAPITAKPEELDFGATVGTTSSSFGIVNDYPETLTWYIGKYDCKWIASITPDKGTLSHGETETIIIRIDRSKLDGGENKTIITVTSENGQGVDITIKATGALKEPPLLNVSGISDIDMTSAKLSGEIVKPGIPAYSRRGFTCSLTSLDDSAAELSAEVNDNSFFSYSISGLTPGKKYYVRAFAVNESFGKVWSANEISFTTIETNSSVKTLDVTNVDPINGKAQFNGEITVAGSPEYTEKGFCYNTTGEPTTSNTKKSVSGSGAGVFYYSCAGLSSNMTYYVRAYAIQNGKIIYGSTVNFSTDMSTTNVSTSGATNVTPSSATLNGSIVKEGSPKYTEKGFCYSTSSNPTVSSTKKVVSGTGEGNFSINISNLSYNTTYYYKAYAIQNGTVIYGSEVNFNTGYTETVVETYSSVSNVEYESAKVSFIINNTGDPACTEAGICYSTSSTPTINSNKIKGNISTYKQSLTITGLQKSTTYYFRAYAIQNGQAVYGSTFTFKTATEPSVSTLAPSGLQNPIGLPNFWQVQLNGRVNSVGDPKITDRGFKYSSFGDPESSGTKISISGSSAGNFSASLTGLTGLNDNTTYYVRAYVRNSLGYVYGELISFTTGDSGVVF